MERQMSNYERENTERRAQMLRERIKLDRGPEQETARRLLAKIEKKLAYYGKQNNSLEEEITDDIYVDLEDYLKYYHYHKEERHLKCQREDELKKEYEVFGKTYQTILNYHILTVVFKRTAERQQALERVYADIYEDGNIICEDVIIGFWKINFKSKICDNVEMTITNSQKIKRYNNGCSDVFDVLLERLKNIWNCHFYYTEMPLDYNELDGVEEKQFDEAERKEIIEQVEEYIDSGKAQEYLCRAYKIDIRAQRKFRTLYEFLNESGIVYKIGDKGVYIYDAVLKKFAVLVGYEYSEYGYDLYLLIG